MSRRRSCTPQEVPDKLDPAHVAPAVGYLLSEENHDTGSVFVGSGLVQRVARFPNDGVTFGRPPGLEEMARPWPQVSDMSDAKPGTSPV